MNKKREKGKKLAEYFQRSEHR